MAAPLYRAWHFLHPGFDVTKGAPGLRVSRTGGIEMVAEHASVRQAILLLLTTKPGERLMRPEYGCDLHRLVFAPNDATTHGLAIHYVRQALQRWEPRVDIVRLDADCNESDPGRMDILLEYRMRRTLRQDALVLPINLTREEV
jgi:hypothetical protein